MTIDSLKLPRIDVVKREEWITQYCSGKDVLHLGCADALYTNERLKIPATLMHYRLHKVAHHIVGIDNSKKDVDTLKAHWPEWEIVIGDVEHLDSIKLTRKFDVIVAGELIEHLLNPGLFLTSAICHLKPKVGRIVITTPNHFGTRRFLHLFFNREKYHPHHTTYYSFNTIKNLTERCGYALDTALGYCSPMPKNLLKQIFYVIIERLPYKVFSSHACDGIIFIIAPQ